MTFDFTRRFLLFVRESAHDDWLQELCTLDEARFEIATIDGETVEAIANEDFHQAKNCLCLEYLV